MIDFKQMTLILLFITAISIFAILYKILAKLNTRIMRCLLLCVGTVLISFGITYSLSDMIYAITPITDVRVMRYDDKQIYEYIYNVNDVYENKDMPENAILFTTKEWLFIKNVTAEINSLKK